MTAELLDVRHLGQARVIALYLIEEPELALVDCGPSVCVATLQEVLAERGLGVRDLRHLLLTHIHPDHAGAAGTLVRECPDLQIHVHEVGAQHLIAPKRLEESARSLYGADFDRLFGPIEPCPVANVRVLDDHVLGLRVIPTPGHARHHVAFLGPDGACYSGDAAGVVIPPGRFLYPAAAPPGIDLDAWERSLDAIEQCRPVSLRLPHFGEVDDVAGHIDRMRHRLRQWADRIRHGASLEEFVAAACAELNAEADAETAALYRQMPGFDLTYAGLKRSIERRAKGGS